MNFQRLNLFSNIYFYLILLSGLLYSSFLIIASTKILPGFIMQFIFLLDSLKFNNPLLVLIDSKSFLINLSAGFVLIFLLSKYFTAFYTAIKSLQSTASFIDQYKHNSFQNFAFTAGLLKPKIYISPSLYKSHTPSEINAIIFHETNHRQNFHPLKIFLTRLVQNVLPAIPGTNWLTENYLTLTEVSSDEYAATKINNKLPLVSALLKLQQTYQNPISLVNVNFFNSQSERIKILVGQKKHLLSLPLAYYSVILTSLFLGTFFIKDTNLFFNCSHLLNCLQTLIASHSNSLLISAHCQ